MERDKRKIGDEEKIKGQEERPRLRRLWRKKKEQKK